MIAGEFVAVTGLALALAGAALVRAARHPRELRSVAKRARRLGVLLCDYVDDASLLTVSRAYGIHVSATEVEEETARARHLGLGTKASGLQRDANVRLQRRYTLAADRNLLLDAALCRLEEQGVVSAIDDLLAERDEDAATLVPKIEATVPLLLVSGRWEANPTGASVILKLMAIHNSRGRDVAFTSPPFPIACELDLAGLTQRGQVRFTRGGRPLLVAIGTPACGEVPGEGLALIPLAIFQRTYSGRPDNAQSVSPPPLGIDVAQDGL